MQGSLIVCLGSARRTRMPRVFRKAFRQRGQRVVRVDSSVLWVKVRLIIITSVSSEWMFVMEKARRLDSEESRWWALKFCFKFFQPICPRPPLDLECTSVSGDLHPHSTLASSATPSSLWPGHELRKFHYFVRGNDIQFSRYGLQFWASPRLGCCPCCDHSVPENWMFF